MPANKYSDSLLMDALRGSLSNAESFGRGFGVAPVGLLGDINALGREYITSRLPASMQGLLQSMPAAPTTESILSAIPRVTAPRMESSGMEQIGAAANPRGPVNLGRAIASLPSDVAKAGQEFLMANQPVRVVSQVKPSFQYPQQAALDLAQQRAALPVSEGGLGLPANNTPEMRATAMGFDIPTYHGTNTPNISLIDVSKSRPDVQYMKGFFTSDNPNLAGNYGDILMPFLQKQGTTILEKRLAKKSQLEIPEVDTIFDKNKNILVTNNPANIRSRFAAFDPFRKDVATATAMGVALPDLLAAEQPQSSGLLYPLP